MNRQDAKNFSHELTRISTNKKKLNRKGAKAAKRRDKEGKTTESTESTEKREQRRGKRKPPRTPRIALYYSNMISKIGVHSG